MTSIPRVGAYLLNADSQAAARDRRNVLRVDADLTGREGRGRVAVKANQLDRDVDIDDVA